jgi:hypothetical protein
MATTTQIQLAQSTTRGPWDNYAPTRRYVVTSPEGKQYEVTAPASASQADVVAYAQRQVAQSAQSGPWTKYGQQPAQSNPLSDAYRQALLSGDTVTAHKIAVQARAQGVRIAPVSDSDINNSVDQRFAQSVQNEPAAQKVIEGAGKSFADTAQGVGELVGGVSPQQVAQSRRLAQPLMDTGAGKVGYFGGQAAQMLALGGAGGAAAKGLSLAGRAVPYAVSALAGGTFAGAQPVADGESRGLNAALGAGLGAAGEALPGATRFLAGKASPTVSAAKQAAIDTAQRYGIPLHLSQVTDSKALQTLGSASKYLPFSGTASAKAAQQGAFNRALSNQIGENAPALSDDVLTSAAQRIGQGYNDLFARTNVKLQPQTVQKLGALWKQANQDLPPDLGRVVQNQITKYFDAAQANGGTIPGRLYQNIRATLQQVEGGNSPASHLVGQVRKTMQDAAEDSMGASDAATLKTLNGQYNSLKTLQKAVDKRAAGAGGDVAPANLWSLVNSKYGSTPEMRDLARLGQTVLKDPIPDSGTAQRLISYGALTGGAAMPHTLGPMMLAGATVGRALNSPFVARTLPYAGHNLLLGLSGAARPAGRLLPLLARRPDGRPTIANILAPTR